MIEFLVQQPQNENYVHKHESWTQKKENSQILPQNVRSQQLFNI